jgi:hypothetical protein
VILSQGLVLFVYFAIHHRRGIRHGPLIVQVFTATNVVRHILQRGILFLPIVRTLLVNIILIESVSINVQRTLWWSSGASATLWRAVILKLEVDLRIWSGLSDLWMLSWAFRFLAFVVAPAKVASIRATGLGANLFWSNEVDEVLEKDHLELALNGHMASNPVRRNVDTIEDA